MIDKLAIVGVGLIGGSLSLALRRAGVVGTVSGYGRNRENLEKGVSLGVLDDFGASIAETVDGADMVVVAVPLGAMQAVFAELEQCTAADAVITDVGSAKGSVVAAARQSFDSRLARFVPGHPVAGTENSGVEAAFASLYENRRVILTPTGETDPEAAKLVERMWRQCGAEVEYLEVERHDRVLAATSHLPHMLAFALVHQLSGLDEREEIFRYAAGGFRDFTRIASSDPVMWRDICLSNADSLVALMNDFCQEIECFSAAIEAADADRLLQFFGRAKSKRDSLIGKC